MSPSNGTRMRLHSFNKFNSLHPEGPESPGAIEANK